jgi:hypothetical protein
MGNGVSWCFRCIEAAHLSSRSNRPRVGIPTKRATTDARARDFHGYLANFTKAFPQEAKNIILIQVMLHRLCAPRDMP